MPSDDTLDIEQNTRGVLVRVRAAPGSRRNAILGIRQGALRVAVTAAPEKGKANKAIIEVLSDALAVPRSAIEIISGETSSQKRFLIACDAPTQLVQKLNSLTAHR